MKNIIMCGSVDCLVTLMKNDGFELCRIETKNNSDEQTWVFVTDYCGYEYETKVIFQVNEFDENNIPVAINVVKIECGMN